MNQEMTQKQLIDLIHQLVNDYQDRTNLSYSRLCLEMGIDKNYLSKLFNGRVSLTMDKFLTIGNYLGMFPGFLFEYENSQQKERILRLCSFCQNMNPEAFEHLLAFIQSSCTPSKDTNDTK